MGFAGAVFWEFVQNLPLVMGFVAAVWLWARGSKRKAIALILIGSIIGSLLIRFTEPNIHGYYEPVAVTAVNIVTMSILMALFVLYSGSEARWSSWKTDLILGGLGGILVGTAQGLSSPGAPTIGVIAQSLVFAVSAPVVLTGVRILKTKTLLAALAGAILITAIMTIMISLVSYTYFLVGLD